MDDRIERTTRIDAPLDRVWDLVTEPGWWAPSDASVVGERTPGAVTVRESGKYGRFPVRVEQIDPKKYAAFRWASEYPGGEQPADPSTLVEFFVQEVGGSVEVRVVETGFSALGDKAESAFTANASGWEHEMGSLRDRAESRA